MSRDPSRRHLRPCRQPRPPCQAYSHHSGPHAGVRVFPPPPPPDSHLLPGSGCSSLRETTLSTLLCAPPWVRTHFTETENSPGELSLSRIRKAPRWFRFIRISSASCREILPEYHLQREGASEGSGEARLPLPHVPGVQHRGSSRRSRDTGDVIAPISQMRSPRLRIAQQRTQGYTPWQAGVGTRSRRSGS